MPLFAGEWGERVVGAEAEEGDAADDRDDHDEDWAVIEAGDEPEALPDAGAPARPPQPQRPPGRRLVPPEGR